MTVHCNVQTQTDTTLLMARNEPWGTFGAWIKQKRETEKLSQGGAAERAGIDRQQWFRIENGISGTRRETVIKMAKALSADENEALHLAGFATPQNKPQTLPELLDRLAALGIENIHFADNDAYKDATPEQLQELLEAVTVAIDVTLARQKRKHDPTLNSSAVQ